METKFVSITFDEWEEQYKPMNNPRIKREHNYDDLDFDTHDQEDVEFINAIKDENRIWTFGDNGECDYITSGWHYVNRLCYHVTEVPKPADTIVQVLIARYEECKCLTDPEDYETANPQCKECEGSGSARVEYTREMIDEEEK